MRDAYSGWIGVDLDGTLAAWSPHYTWEDIGPPIRPMVARVRTWLAEGRDVRIFTARVDGTYDAPLEAVTAVIEGWCREHLGRVLPVTNAKDWQMVELWDDRARRVVYNTGHPCCDGGDPAAVRRAYT